MADGLKMKYFVLSPTSSDPVHAEASREAINAYAGKMRATNPELAADLFRWIDELDVTHAIPKQ